MCVVCVPRALCDHTCLLTKRLLLIRSTVHINFILNSKTCAPATASTHQHKQRVRSQSQKTLRILYIYVRKCFAHDRTPNQNQSYTNTLIFYVRSNTIKKRICEIQPASLHELTIVPIDKTHAYGEVSGFLAATTTGFF